MKIRAEITALDFVTNFDKLTGLCIGSAQGWAWHWQLRQ